MPFRRHQEGGDLCAIFVHAGAGYHSHANEKHHLMAVEDASKVAMALLQNGGDAVDAVEMAIKLLEDREITNAGYGSNLTMSGEVESDATMVDHFGRSGAVGAVSQVRNPIGLARLVLEESTKPLSLQRVPPNLLVGPGARDFAYDKGIPIMPPEFLVSAAARERWLRWKQDLQNAEAREQSAREAQSSSWAEGPGYNTNDSIAAFSPPTSPAQQITGPPTLTQLPTPTRPLQASTADLPTLKSIRILEQHNSESNMLPPAYSPNRVNGRQTPWGNPQEPAMDDELQWTAKRQRMDGDGSTDEIEALPPEGNAPKYSMSLVEEEDAQSREDNITDTVGAIAVDCWGNIAAGSSSGGIGMKHRGRCGPAALVGIGTAVKPVDPDDPDQVCVAAVTSGTGEHMATTMAAATVADRIYHSVRKRTSKRASKKDKEDARVPGLENCDEDQAMRSMIKHEFMSHPGVKNSHCAGAIGIMAVKKTKDGIYFYFGHNTDSFALASLHNEEKRTTCVMSRSNGNGSIAQGGRAMHHNRRGKF